MGNGKRTKSVVLCLKHGRLELLPGTLRERLKQGALKTS